MNTLTKGGVDRASALSLCSDNLTTRTATPEVAELESRPKRLQTDFTCIGAHVTIPEREGLSAKREGGVLEVLVASFNHADASSRRTESQLTEPRRT